MVIICVLQFFRCNLIGIALTLENQFYFELDRTPLEFNVQPNDAPLAHTTSPVFLVAIYLYYCLRIRPSSIVWPFIYQLVINNKRSVNDIDSSFKIELSISTRKQVRSNIMNRKLCCEGNGNSCRKRVEQMKLLAKIDEKNER
ncbi:hypothetical protein BLOT_013301 [Blomia tropicalis]|nr:hypothetical protein BLOT_013301 [Blomia tropicalis]